MSALPPKADIVQHGGNVRFGPKGDMRLHRICGFHNPKADIGKNGSGFVPDDDDDEEVTRALGHAINAYVESASRRRHHVARLIALREKDRTTGSTLNASSWLIAQRGQPFESICRGCTPMRRVE
jgi:hypothetical protein